MDERGGFITLAEAAELGGYKSAGNLRQAAATGKLRTIKAGQRVNLTRREWVEEYMATLRQGNYHRGTPRKSTPPEEETPS